MMRKIEQIPCKNSIVSPTKNIQNYFFYFLAITLAARNIFGKNETAVTCYDPHLAVIINTGLRYYSHNMGQLASYILTQVHNSLDKNIYFFEKKLKFVEKVH
jgi:hypothetical protein